MDRFFYFGLTLSTPKKYFFFIYCATFAVTLDNFVYINSIFTFIESMKTERSCFLITKCCFCVPLRAGCFILGYISLLLNLLITLFFVGSIAVMAIFTHGFRYFHVKQTQNGDVVPHESAEDKAKLHMAVTLVLLVGCLNIAWLMFNVFLLVGLHKKRPGPFKLHAAVATVRLIFSVMGLGSVQISKPTLVCWVEICVSAYFITLYYAYSMQLEREQSIKEKQSIQDKITNMLVFNNPNNIDKKSLTNKNHIENMV